MEITFYNTVSEHNRVDKVLTDAATFDGHLREGASILAPTITIAKGIGLIGYNYAQIPQFNRYYYVTDIVSVANGLWQVSLSVDALMSWKNYIKKVTAIAERSENVFNLYLPDSEWKNDARSLIQYRTIGSFTGLLRVLTVLGGVPHS